MKRIQAGEQEHRRMNTLYTELRPGFDSVGRRAVAHKKVDLSHRVADQLLA